MRKIPKISESEYDVMEVLWKDGDWMDVPSIHTALTRVKKWAYNTVGTFLVRLTGKGFLETEKRGRSNFYRAVITEQEYVTSQTEEFLKSVHKGSKKSLIAALYQDDSTSDEEIRELIQWVEHRKG